MTVDIIGRGWAFPPRIDAQGIVLTGSQNEIEQAIRIILETTPGERVMRPTFGSRLHELVFAPNNAETAAQAARYVREALGMWEPRIRVLNVVALPNEGATAATRLTLQIEYEVKQTNDRRALVYPFYLIPEEAQEATR